VSSRESEPLLYKVLFEQEKKGIESLSKCRGLGVYKINKQGAYKKFL
jgi:hypothetical protein